MKFSISLTLLIISSVKALNLNEICHGILFQAIPHPEDPNLFIGCVQGKGTIFGCENMNDVFDPETVTCVDPNTITTTDQTISTTQEFTTGPTTVPPPPHTTTESKKND